MISKADQFSQQAGYYCSISGATQPLVGYVNTIAVPPFPCLFSLFPVVSANVQLDTFVPKDQHTLLLAPREHTLTCKVKSTLHHELKAFRIIGLLTLFVLHRSHQHLRLQVLQRRILLPPSQYDIIYCIPLQPWVLVSYWHE
jgi:hypothetical protein